MGKDAASRSSQVELSAEEFFADIDSIIAEIRANLYGADVSSAARSIWGPCKLGTGGASSLELPTYDDT